RDGVKIARAKGMPAGWWEVKTIGASKDAFRKSLLASGHHVDKLRRVAIANIELGPVPSGRYRHIPREEISALEHVLSRGRS
ncbi:MAG TPA: hypothetical protein VJR23_07970, partial [Candidatus Acidoferrales bacterium]|nr:hypothetical protein [Candidatus Acidoferrales bacterium]